MDALGVLDLNGLLEEVRNEIRPHFGWGCVANYIPALKRVPARKFGMAVVLTDGRDFSVGDATEPFSIQSVSKLLRL